MGSTERQPLRPGDRAPDFSLPAVQRDGMVSLGDYRGRTPVLLAFFRGIYCPFCRRHIAKLGLAQDKLRAAGVETLAVVASNLERTRLYFRYQPPRVPIAVDPALNSHRAFGVSQFPATPELMEAVQSTRIDGMGELAHPLPIMEAVRALDERDRFEFTDTDTREEHEQGLLDTGQFLVDRDGIVRWVNLESAREGLAGLGKFPSDEELLSVAWRHAS